MSVVEALDAVWFMLHALRRDDSGLSDLLDAALNGWFGWMSPAETLRVALRGLSRSLYDTDRSRFRRIARMVDDLSARHPDVALPARERSLLDLHMGCFYEGMGEPLAAMYCWRRFLDAEGDTPIVRERVVELALSGDARGVRALTRPEDIPDSDLARTLAVLAAGHRARRRAGRRWRPWRRSRRGIDALHRAALELYEGLPRALDARSDLACLREYLAVYGGELDGRAVGRAALEKAHGVRFDERRRRFLPA